MRQLWTRFRWWVARLACPQMRVIIRIGKQVTPERFAAVKVYTHTIECLPEHRFDIRRHRVLEPNVSAMAIIDMGTVAEGQSALTPEEIEAMDPDFVPKSQEEMASLLKDALKGTPLEGLDEAP